jgi:hypothetical protein
MKRDLLFVFMIFLITGCGGKKNNPAPTPTPKPAQVTLSVPAQNSACTSGTIISSTESSITFL